MEKPPAIRPRPRTLPRTNLRAFFIGEHPPPDKVSEKYERFSGGKKRQNIGSNRRLKIHWRAAPGFGIDIREGLGEIPSMAEEVLRVVLPFAIHMIDRFGEDDGAVPAGTLAVSAGIFDAYLRDMGIFRDGVAFGDGEAALAGAHLNAMVGDAQTHCEAERLRQPISGDARVGIVKNWNNGAWRNGAIGAHGATLPFTTSLIDPAILRVPEGQSIREQGPIRGPDCAESDQRVCQPSRQGPRCKSHRAEVSGCRIIPTRPVCSQSGCTSQCIRKLPRGASAEGSTAL